MSDSQRNFPQSYVSAHPGGESHGPVILPPETPHVVIASNQASDWRVVILAGVFLALMTLVVWIVAHYGFQLHQGWSAVLALLVFAACGRFTLIIVNGDWVAHREINATERSERKRIDAQSSAITEHYEFVGMAETNRHAEEMARIEAHAIHSRVQGDVAYLMDQVQALRPLLADSGPPAPAHVFVTAKPDDARLACEKWLCGLWDREGTPKFVAGQLPMPWNSPEWRGAPWCEDAQRLLQDSGILVKRAGGRTFTVVPNSRRDAMTMLDARKL